MDKKYSHTSQEQYFLFCLALIFWRVLSYLPYDPCRPTSTCSRRWPWRSQFILCIVQYICTLSGWVWIAVMNPAISSVKILNFQCILKNKRSITDDMAGFITAIYTQPDKVHMYWTIQSMNWDLQGHRRPHVEVERQGSYRRYDRDDCLLYIPLYNKQCVIFIQKSKSTNPLGQIKLCMDPRIKK